MQLRLNACHSGPKISSPALKRLGLWRREEFLERTYRNVKVVITFLQHELRGAQETTGDGGRRVTGKLEVESHREAKQTQARR
jgi:hypothetical protein